MREENSESETQQIWSPEAVKLMLATYEKRKEKKKSIIWEDIAGVMRAHGHEITSDQCHAK